MRQVACSLKLHHFLFVLIGGALLTLQASSAEWQWSVPAGSGRAFLWIPPECQQVQALIVGQHNMLEETIFEHAQMRAALTKLRVAEVWIAPPHDAVFDFEKGAGERFDETMKALAAESGYSELAWVPAIPIGHSACASYPWNFGAWNPERTLAMISIHGDAPLTHLTGSGQPNPSWGNRNIDGIPGLMIMGEYEWLEERLTPALAFREHFPKSPIAVLAEPGCGHFDASDGLVNFITVFIRKAVEQRLPSDATAVHAPKLKLIDPTQGWLVERWHLNRDRQIPAAPSARYSGDPKQAFWCFDEEMAHATEKYRANQIGKKPQLLAFVQDGKPVPQRPDHAQVNLRFLPLEDGITFDVSAKFVDSVEGGSPNLARWTQLPVGAPLGHASDDSPITLSRITGPVAQISANTFVVQLNRTASTTDRRSNDIWLLASHPGDGQFKSVVQQALLRISPNTTGTEQRIAFPEIRDRNVGANPLKLAATSSAGVPVYYYVREGPAEIEGDTLRFTVLPPRAKFPVKVTVVAWQWGRCTEPKLKAATPVERTFSLNP
jgi:hypothetical protein